LPNEDRIGGLVQFMFECLEGGDRVSVEMNRSSGTVLCLCEVDGAAVGFVGELHPRWRQAYELPTAPVVFELDLAALLARDVPEFKPLPRHQSVWRDLSLVAKEAVSHEALVAAIRATPTPVTSRYSSPKRAAPCSTLSTSSWAAARTAC